MDAYNSGSYKRLGIIEQIVSFDYRVCCPVATMCVKKKIKISLKIHTYCNASFNLHIDEMHSYIVVHLVTTYTFR